MDTVANRLIHRAAQEPVTEALGRSPRRRHRRAASVRQDHFGPATRARRFGQLLRPRRSHQPGQTGPAALPRFETSPASSSSTKCSTGPICFRFCGCWSTATTTRRGSSCSGAPARTCCARAPNRWPDASSTSSSPASRWPRSALPGCRDSGPGRFPRSFLADTDADSVAWRKAFIRTFVRTRSAAFRRRTRRPDAAPFPGHARALPRPDPQRRRTGDLPRRRPGDRAGDTWICWSTCS